MKKIMIDTPCGQMEGFCDEEVRKFLGIRYATAGRWEYPKEITSWEGIYSALHFGAAPVQKRAYTKEVSQKDGPGEYEFMLDVKAKYSEDCLFLNIWAPLKAEHCPVLIAIYGGGLLSGQTDELELDGTVFAQKGIIVVTLNYRVNIFGFLAMKQLEDENGKSGNYGYYDQYTAIQWVRHNIEAFGGDPSRMTLIGQSAGAASAEAQIKSPLNKDVFQGAIIQSSAGFTTVLKAKDNRESVYRKWEALYRQSGCKSIDEFRKMPAEQLYALFEKVSEKNPIEYATTVYDENFTGNAKNAPCSTNIICSFTSQDVMPLLLFLLCKMLAKSQRGRAETYGYYFQRQLPGDTYGAWHGSDLWYTYGTLHRSWRPFSDEDRKLSEIMMDYFVQFIKTGNPNCRNHPEWKPLTEKKFMMFDADKSQMGRLAWGSLLKATLFPQKFEK